MRYFASDSNGSSGLFFTSSCIPCKAEKDHRCFHYAPTAYLRFHLPLQRCDFVGDFQIELSSGKHHHTHIICCMYVVS